jgi:hypothetical protein
MLLWLALTSAAFLPSTMAKERPKYSEIPFTNVTHRTNLCSLSMDYFTGAIELSDALKGLHLTACLFRKKTIPENLKTLKT